MAQFGKGLAMKESMGICFLNFSTYVNAQEAGSPSAIAVSGCRDWGSTGKTASYNSHIGKLWFQ